MSAAAARARRGKVGARIPQTKVAEALEEIEWQFPKAFQPLFTPKRWKVFFGGRDAAKSWNFARALLYMATQDPLRILCCREILDTLADSVHQLLQDQIKNLGLESFFTVRENEILGANGCRFFYAGLRSLDAHKVKSFEGIDIVWVEEAHNVSERSWLLLENTIRADGSEIWVSFNPELDTDPTYVRFVEQPQPESIVVHVSFRDNPFASKVLVPGREALKLRDREEYDHTWEGKPNTVVAGALYKAEIAAMLREPKRFRPCPYDPNLLVHTVWDIGWNDATAIGFAQVAASEVRIIDYEEESFLRPDQWAKRINDKPYAYGDHWLPHDGDNELLAAGGKSLKLVLKPMLRVTPKIITRPESVEDPIRAARQMFPRVYINSESKAVVDSNGEVHQGCARLWNCLKRFRRAIPETTGEPGAPVKDEFRHGADMFGGLATIVGKLKNVREAPPRTLGYQSPDPGSGM